LIISPEDVADSSKDDLQEKVMVMQVDLPFDSDANDGWLIIKLQKEQNNQQQGFAGGHQPNY
jgi:hypothetical protein